MKAQTETIYVPDGRIAAINQPKLMIYILALNDHRHIQKIMRIVLLKYR